MNQSKLQQRKVKNITQFFLILLILKRKQLKE